MKEYNLFDKSLMIIALFILAMFFMGCLESPKTPTSLLPDICDSTPLFGNQMIVDNNGQNIGYFIEASDGYIWFQNECSNHTFALNAQGALRESIAMAFSDSNCQIVIGEIFDYPLNLSGDIYTFQFEGEIYEYPIEDGQPIINVENYYYKTNGGSCDLTIGPTELRIVEPSTSSIRLSYSL